MEKPSTLLLSIDDGTGEQLNVSELRKHLESPDENNKIYALKKIISMILSGEKLPQLLMPIIQYVMTSKNHTIKKLLLFYWEIIEMVANDGKVLSEMILVCNSWRNDLIHPNEYIRGSTLRFVCKLKIPELLEPLVPCIIKNLEHRHSYVRRNAVQALNNIYSRFSHLCPDAPNLIFDFIQKYQLATSITVKTNKLLYKTKEEDSSCKRNAFFMLFNSAQEKAVEYLNEVSEQVSSMTDTLQLAIIDVIRMHKATGISDIQRARYVRTVLSLLKATSPSVQYESAVALLELQSSPISVKASASTLIELLCTQSDNNVKLIILDKLDGLKKKHNKVLQELLMDILRALASPSLDIRKKTLDFAMNLVNQRNIDEVVLLLKKEISKTQSDEVDKAADYRKLLIKAIHSCALKFPDVAGSVVHALMDYISDNSTDSAIDVVTFVGEVVETYPEHRQSIVRKLLENISAIESTSVLRVALWIVGEYSESVEDIDVGFTQIKELLGPIPFQFDDEEEKVEIKVDNAPKQSAAVNRILADGTYASQSAYVPTPEISPLKKKRTYLREEILKGNFVLASITGMTLTKLAIKLQLFDVADSLKYTVSAEVMLMITSILQYREVAQKFEEPTAIEDSSDTLHLSLRLLLDPNPFLVEALLEEARKASRRQLDEWKQAQDVEPEAKKTVEIEVDDVIPVRLLQTSKYADEDASNEALKGNAFEEVEDNIDESPLSRVYQLTGFSDPLYAECYTKVHRFDIVLDVLVMNRTKDTLQNVSLELATLGEKKIRDRPHLQTYTIGPNDKIWIKSNLKISSTETSVFYGNLVYDIAGSTASDKHCVVLNNIRVDVVDYIKPATCNDTNFRTMWYEFEWENKVPVNTKHTSVKEFLEDITKATNMKCLTPLSAREEECGFLSANLYAKSIFGEDALANVSVEQLETGEITGYVRIRSKTQGIAISLGDKIAQRSQ